MQVTLKSQKHLVSVLKQKKKKRNRTVEPYCTLVSCMEMSKSKQLFFASIYLFLHFTVVNQNKLI